MPPKQIKEAPSKRMMRLSQMNSRDLYFVRRERTFYCLNVTPAKETLVSQQLMERGLDSFIPIKMVWRRSNKTTREKKQVPFVAFPGYVFLGTKGHSFPWGRIYGLHYIKGALGFNGVPQALEINQEMENFLGKFREGLETPKEQQHMRSNLEYQAGDMTEVLSGVYQGHVVEVVSLRGKKAKALVKLFGSMRNVEFDAYELGKVA